MTVRIIPRLDIKGPNLVKGIHLEGLRVLGKPESFAQLYYETGADELLFMDAVASLYGRNSLNQVISLTARQIFIPLCVGGGLRSIEDIRSVLRAGADKVAINTAALRRPGFISEAAGSFGSSTIVVSIAALRRPDGKYECFTEGGREPMGVDAIEWAATAAELGAGELLITSIDNEGTGKGFDLDLLSQVTAVVSVPVLASGGAGKVEHVREVFEASHVDGVCLASVLHYDGVSKIDFSAEDFTEEGNIEFRKERRLNTKIAASDIPGIKRSLKEAGVVVRL